MKFPTEEEAEYPWGLCQTYARVLKAELAARQLLPDERLFRVSELERELAKYSRFEDEELKHKVASRIYDMECDLVEGREDHAFAQLLRNGHYRGTDIRLTVENEGDRKMVPYPAYRWLWRETMSYRWKQDAHTNELEAQALVAHLRRLLKEPSVFGVRVMVVVDSQVLFYAVGKGRSPSKRLNRLLRRLSALELAGDVYLLPIWTLSAWNYADNPSRR